MDETQESPQTHQVSHEESQQFNPNQPETKWQKLKSFFKESRRVLRVTKKPNKEEFMTVFKVTAIGTLIIGAMGFIIFILKQLLFGGTI